MWHVESFKKGPGKKTAPGAGHKLLKGAKNYFKKPLDKIIMHI